MRSKKDGAFIFLMDEIAIAITIAAAADPKDWNDEAKSVLYKCRAFQTGDTDLFGVK